MRKTLRYSPRLKLYIYEKNTQIFPEIKVLNLQEKPCKFTKVIYLLYNLFGQIYNLKQATTCNTSENGFKTSIPFKRLTFHLIYHILILFKTK